MCSLVYNLIACHTSQHRYSLTIGKDNGGGRFELEDLGHFFSDIPLLVVCSINMFVLFDRHMLSV